MCETVNFSYVIRNMLARGVRVRVHVRYLIHLRIVQTPADLFDANTPVIGDPPAASKVALRHRIEERETLETIDARAYLQHLTTRAKYQVMEIGLDFRSEIFLILV